MTTVINIYSSEGKTTSKKKKKKKSGLDKEFDYSKAGKELMG
jgi:hypothetical protein|tara:strand:+ start:177 stop:302 length:126 start_codon:yes stop_codon:yes gene_type:complete